MSLILDGTNGVSDIDGSASTPAIRGTDTNTGIFFPAADTIAFSEGGAEVARFDSSGNLGIGTASPASGYRLDVDGSIRLGAGSNLSWGETYSNNAPTIAGSLTSGFLAFYPNGASSGEKMRITSGGPVLFGSTIDAWGGIGSGIQVGSSATMSIYTNTTGYKSRIYTGGRGIEFDNDSASRDYFFTKSSGSVFANLSAVILNQSDYRLKDNISDITNSLNKVLLLKPRSFSFKETVTPRQPYGTAIINGFIAHELQEVIPEAVQGQKDAINEDGSIKAQGIDTSHLIPLLTAAIQEQQAIITDLKARLEALEAK